MNSHEKTLNSRSKRDSNIELLRIVAMIGVIILHFINADIGGGIVFTANDNAKYAALSVARTMFIPAVDIFLMISGYFMCSKSAVVVDKAFKLILQVIVTNELIYVLRMIIGNDSFSIKHLMANFIPMNYYVIMYVALYLLSPYINKLFSLLDDKKFSVMVILLCCLFSLWPTLVNISEHIMNSHYEGLSTISIKGDQSGYNFVNFFLCYSLGVFARRMKSKQNNKLLVLGFVFSFVFLLAWYLIGTKLGKELSVYSYSNPLVLIMAWSVLLLVTELKIGNNKVINYIAKMSFTVFLSHMFYLKLIPVDYICSLPLPLMILGMFVSCFLIYFACIPFYYLFELLYKLIDVIITKFKFRKKFEIRV